MPSARMPNTICVASKSAIDVQIVVIQIQRGILLVVISLIGPMLCLN
jgi:hypothetical protein